MLLTRQAVLLFSTIFQLIFVGNQIIPQNGLLILICMPTYLKGMFFHFTSEMFLASNSLHNCIFSIEEVEAVELNFFSKRPHGLEKIILRMF